MYSAPSNSWAPAVASTTIDSADWNTLRSDLSTALSTAICKDGQTTITDFLPMSTYRHTEVSNATALDQYATADQVVDNALCYGGASAAGTDTYAVNLAVSPGAYAAGQRYSFIADVANTGACTINFNTIGAASIKMQDGTDPYDNAIIANQIVEVEYDGTNMVLLNPETSSIYINTTDNNQRIDASGTTNDQKITFGSSGVGTTSSVTVETDSGTGGILKVGSGSALVGKLIIDNDTDHNILFRTGSPLASKMELLHAGGLTVSTAAPATPAANTLYADSMVKAWAFVQFTTGTPSVIGEVNIGTPVDNGVGDITLPFVTSMSTNTFAALVSVYTTNKTHSIAQATSGVTVRIRDLTPSPSDTPFNITVAGPQ